jgi:peptide/nickel transport system permease protein
MASLLYLLKKLSLAPLLVWAVVTLIFVLLELSPGDVADKYFNPETPPEVRAMIVAKYHLDDPAGVRYLAMLRNLVTFDFGRSMAQDRPVFDIIWQALPNTVLLSGISLLVTYPTGILVGTLQALRQNRPPDTVASVATLLLYSMPEFWLAMMLQLVAARTGLLPTSGMMDPVSYEYMSPSEQLWDRALHLVLPGVAMGLTAAGVTARYMRSSMLEVIRQDYVRTARAKGLREGAVIVRHAMRNAMLPVITLMGLSVPALFSGTLIIETIFAWPGMGRTIVGAIFAQDTPLIIACFYVFTLLVVAGNLLADLAYAWADPRIRLQ